MKLLSCVRLSLVLLSCVGLFAPRLAHADEPITNVEQPPVPEQRWILPVVGASTLAASYLPVASMGAVSFDHALDETVGNQHWSMVQLCGGAFPPCPPVHHHEAALLIVPIAGPFLYARSSERDDDFRKQGPPTTTERVLLYADGVAQAGGLAVATLGVARMLTAPSSVRVADGKPAMEWTVVPTATPAGSSVSVMGTF